MRISDWSSDVCSSDLDHDRRRSLRARGGSLCARRSGAGVPPPGAELWLHAAGRCARGAEARHCLRRRVQDAGNQFFPVAPDADRRSRSEEHTSELQSLMRISYAVFCLKKKNKTDIKVHKETQQLNI